MSTEIHIDALLPAEMARRAELLGVRKAEMKLLSMLALAVLAGAFIRQGAAFAPPITAGTSGEWPYGVTRLLTGLVFCLGLILVIVGGAELFTGNNLIVMAWASKKVTTSAMLRNWIIVYLGNFIGSLGTALVIFLGKQYTFGGGAVGTTVLTIANSKVHLDFIQAIALGIMCNAMVCLAVWMSYSARSVTDKILAIIFPISGFVAAGFEHSVANMYFIPIGLFIKQFDPAFVAKTGLDVGELTWGTFLVNNLLPVTIGNIIGGAGLVAIVYWFIFLRESPAK
jgi:formate/nitrite transporter